MAIAKTMTYTQGAFFCNTKSMTYKNSLFARRKTSKQLFFMLFLYCPFSGQRRKITATVRLAAPFKAFNPLSYPQAMCTIALTH